VFEANQDAGGDEGFPGEADEGEWVPVSACGSLTGLTNLKDLCICRESLLVPGDALAPSLGYA
jgi:hypothetical protein